MHEDDMDGRGMEGAGDYGGPNRRMYSNIEVSIVSLDKRVAILEQRQELFEKHMHGEHTRLHERIEGLRTDMNGKLDSLLKGQQVNNEALAAHTKQENDDRRAMLVRVTWFLIVSVLALGGWAVLELISHLKVDR